MKKRWLIGRYKEIIEDAKPINPIIERIADEVKKQNSLKMGCPVWKDCDKKGCIEQEVCTGDYWFNYWRNKALLAQQEKLTSKKRRKARRDAQKEPCTKYEGKCDKQKTCEILGQCVITLPFVAEMPSVLEALRGKQSVKQIIKIFAQHNPTPMKSYYRKPKNKK